MAADPPNQVLGIFYPPGLTTPVENPEHSNEQKAQGFIEWIATYWNPLQTPESITASTLAYRYDMYEAAKDDKYLPLTSRLSKSELDALVAPHILPRIGVAMMFAPEVYAEALNQAVFDTKGQWENLKMVGLWPDMTIWCCSLSGKVMADMLAEPMTEGKVRRKVEMVRMNGTNHIVSSLPLLLSYAKLIQMHCLVSLRRTREVCATSSLLCIEFGALFLATIYIVDLDVLIDTLIPDHISPNIHIIHSS